MTNATNGVGQGNLPHIAVLLRADGTAESVEFSDSYELLRSHFDCFTRVSLPAADAEFWAEDNGFAMGLPVNAIATRLYWERCGVGTAYSKVPANFTPIVGDIVITASTHDGDSTGLAVWQRQYLAPLLDKELHNMWMSTYLIGSPWHQQWTAGELDRL